MMKNDTNMTCQLKNFQIENQLLNFCVDKSVGGKSPEVSRHVLKVGNSALIWSSRGPRLVERAGHF